MCVNMCKYVKVCYTPIHLTAGNSRFASAHHLKLGL